MIILPKKVRVAHAREIRSLVVSGVPRKKAFLQVSVAVRADGFKCVPRTIYRWLKEARVTLPR